MPMGLRIVNCIATPNSVIVFFSAPVNEGDTGSGAKNRSNYKIECPIGSDISPSIANIVLDPTNKMFVTISFSSEPGFSRGLWLSVRVRNVSVFGHDDDRLPTHGTPEEPDDDTNTIATQINGDETAIAKETRAVEDAVSFPILTEEVGFAPSPVARISSNLPAAPGAAPLGQIVTSALNDVLGWKIKAGDAKGFVGALNASFVCSDMEGRTECKWTPRSYAVQTDLSGGITGAQASIYSRAKDALAQALPLLDGLSALDPEAATEDVTALKAIVHGQLTELVKELGQLGGPRVSRVNQYFGLLIGLQNSSPNGVFPNPPSQAHHSLSKTDPDQIAGTLGNLRDELGLNFTTQDFVNSVADEEDLSNYRILSDYVTSLAQSWLDNLPFFGLNGGTPKKFFGTQLVLLSRQLSVVAESVDEVRFTLDSVFIGPAERQTLLLNFNSGDPSIFVEDLLTWIQGFASDEGPRLIQDGGKFGVQNTFLPVAKQLQGLVNGVRDVNGTNNGLPSGFHTARVRRAFQELNGQLTELVNLASPIQHFVTPQPEFNLPLAITSIDPPSSHPSDRTPILLTIRGEGFQPRLGDSSGSPPQGPVISFTPTTITMATTTFFHSDRLLSVGVTIPLTAPGTFDVTVTNPDTSTATLRGGFTVTR
jgi:hypothetical protein